MVKYGEYHPNKFSEKDSLNKLFLFSIEMREVAYRKKIFLGGHEELYFELGVEILYGSLLGRFGNLLYGGWPSKLFLSNNYTSQSRDASQSPVQISEDVLLFGLVWFRYLLLTSQL